MRAFTLRAREESLPARAVVADARSFELGAFDPLVIMPIRWFSSSVATRGRAVMLASDALHLDPGGLLVVALADLYRHGTGRRGAPSVPEHLQADDWCPPPRRSIVREEGDGGHHPPPPGGVSDGELTEEMVTLRLDSVTPAEFQDGGRDVGYMVLASATRPRHAGLRRKHRRHVEAPRQRHPARLRALSRAMNIDADRGKIAVLRARREWRGSASSRHRSAAGEPRDVRHDLFYIGGGQDRDQSPVAEDMPADKRDSLHAAADRGAVVLAVCGGYQLLGESYTLGERELPGSASWTCERCARRASADRNCVIEADSAAVPS